MKAGRTVILGDLHTGVEGREPSAADRHALERIVQYAQSYGAQLIFSGDGTDRVLAKKSREAARTMCAPVAEILCRYCEETLQQVHRVIGNHDPYGQEINEWFPGVYFKHHGAFLHVEDASVRDGGLFLTHGHFFTSVFRNRYGECMQCSEQSDPCMMLRTVFDDSSVQSAAARSWTNILLPPFIETLKYVRLKQRVERFLFDLVERKRMKDQRKRDNTTQSGGTYPAPHDQAAWTAECAAQWGHGLGISGHTHRPYIHAVTTTQGTQVIVANAGGWLPSDPWPRSFLEAYDDVIALHSVRENGRMEKGDPVPWTR